MPDSFDSSAMTAAIRSAPAWARIGLTVRDLRLRERAAQEVAETVLGRLERGKGEDHTDQLPLAF